jgi:hypothetical protein
LVCFSVFSIFIFIKKDNILLNESDIIKLKEKVQDISEKEGKHKDEYILKLVKYPSVEFKLSDNKLENKLKIGDSVSIGIRKIDYNRLIIKVIPKTIWHFPLPNSIEVYTLNTKHKSIIDLEDYYYENKLNPMWALMFYLTSSIVCLIIALANFYNYKTV